MLHVDHRQKPLAICSDRMRSILLTFLQFFYYCGIWFLTKRGQKLMSFNKLKPTGLRETRKKPREKFEDPPQVVGLATWAAYPRSAAVKGPWNNVSGKSVTPEVETELFATHKNPACWRLNVHCYSDQLFDHYFNHQRTPVSLTAIGNYEALLEFINIINHPNHQFTVELVLCPHYVYNFGTCTALELSCCAFGQFTIFYH